MSWLLWWTTVAAVPALSAPEDEAAPEAEELPSVYLLRFASPSLARSNGTDALSGQRRDRARKLDAKSAASRDTLAAIDREQANRLALVGHHLGRTPEVIFHYRAVLNGAAVRLTPGEAAAVALMPGIAAVTADREVMLTTDAGPSWIGAAEVWSAAAPLGTRGEGVVIGIIDSGINLDHPSFSDTPVDGHVYVNPNGSGNFLGWCDPLHPQHDPSFVCNDKLIGAWDFVEAVIPLPDSENDGPEDDYFHGSHVASIAAGNSLGLPPLSGVAPHANLISYDVCYTKSFAEQPCLVSAIIAAVDQAVLDGVDVLNISIGNSGDPWQDWDLALLDAVAAGIFVAVSAGNDGPAANTVGHRGPWVSTVGASTHDRLDNVNAVGSFSGGSYGLAPLPGRSLTGGYGPAPIVDAGDCSSPFASGTFPSGEIVVCDFTGFLEHMDLCENVADGGAGGCVLANFLGGPSFTLADAHVIPATHLAAGDTLRAWLASGSGHQATITPTLQLKDPAVADLIRDFSSRGPAVGLDVLKPDLVAPGWFIYGATTSFSYPTFSGAEYTARVGTSMASPHVAGAAALLIVLHPDWTPSEIKSALMTTAVTSLWEQDAVTPADLFDRGAGRVDVERASRAGLVLDESTANFAAADPATGGEPATLNLASFLNEDCDFGCDYERTVRSTASAAVTWTVATSTPTGMTLVVTPPVFMLEAGASTVLDVAFELADDFSLSAWAFGEIVLTPDDSELASTRLPVAVFRTGAGIFEDGFESGDLTAWHVP